MEVAEGENVTFTCGLRNGDRVSWTVNGNGTRGLIRDKKVTIKRTSVGGRSVSHLVFKNVSSEFDGAEIGCKPSGGSEESAAIAILSVIGMVIDRNQN